MPELEKVEQTPVSRLRAWRAARANRCRVDEEWCGLFIGRRYCSTHSYRWDPGEKPCPGHARPTDDQPEGMWI